MVGSGNGASKWAEMLIGHVWGGLVVGTTCPICPKSHFICWISGADNAPLETPFKLVAYQYFHR